MTATHMVGPESGSEALAGMRLTLRSIGAHETVGHDVPVEHSAMVERIRERVRELLAGGHPKVDTRETDPVRIALTEIARGVE
jgi:hypothetical protein